MATPPSGNPVVVPVQFGERPREYRVRVNGDVARIASWQSTGFSRRAGKGRQQQVGLQWPIYRGYTWDCPLPAVEHGNIESSRGHLNI
jgi:hypothetical protein